MENITQGYVARNPTFRTSAALPAAGAWDTTPLEVNTTEIDEMLLYMSYTRGAAGGAVDWKIEYSPTTSGDNWYQAVLKDPGAIVAGSDTQSEIQREYVTYTSTGAAAEKLVVGNFCLESLVERVRIYARESGVVGTPGTFEILGRLS